MATDPATGHVYLFGGRGASGALFDDLYCLDTNPTGTRTRTRTSTSTSTSNGGGGGAAWQWRVVEVNTGLPPSPRFQHTLCIAAGRLHVWGGANAMVTTSSVAQGGAKAKTGTVPVLWRGFLQLFCVIGIRDTV
jgi:hypothetical protein